MNRRRRSLTFLALAASLQFGGCGPSESANAAQAPRGAENAGDIVIGAAWPWVARKDILYRQGLEMAVDQINAAGGVKGRKLRMVFEDDNESVNDGLIVAQRLSSNPEVVAVIGHLQSYVTVPAASIYEGAGVLMIAPTSSDPALTSKGYRHVFRTISTDTETGRQMAEYAAHQGYRRVAIYYVRSDYGRALANAFEEHSTGLGISVTARASYEPSAMFDARSFEPTLLQWKLLEIDAIFLAGEVPLAGRLIAEMRRLGLDQPVLGGDAMSIPELVTGGGAAVEGTVVAAAFHRAEPRPEVARFTRAFQERYSTDPDPGAALAYDAVYALARALEHAKSGTPDDIARALRDLPAWAGVTGPIAFDDKGDLRSRDIIKLVVRGGRFEPVAAPKERRVE
jgi:branched-chain amino acid transport system substrate-binding protein